MNESNAAWPDERLPAPKPALNHAALRNPEKHHLLMRRPLEIKNRGLFTRNFCEKAPVTLEDQ